MFMNAIVLFTNLGFMLSSFLAMKSPHLVARPGPARPEPLAPLAPKRPLGHFPGTSKTWKILEVTGLS